MPDNDSLNDRNNNNPRRASANYINSVKSKRLFGILLLIGVVAITFGVVRVYNSIRSPFAGRVSLANVQQFDEQDLTVEQLRSVDTDGDQLSDYDELYRYNTSPYLSDSDSDSISDSEEITANTDPNCPSGKDCTGFGESVIEGTSPTDASELRRTLENAGAPQYILDSTSDEDLLALYEQIVSEEPAATNTNTDDSTDIINAADLQNLSAEDIRELLRSNGVDEVALSELDDKTLIAIFLEALNEQFGT